MNTNESIIANCNKIIAKKNIGENIKHFLDMRSMSRREFEQILNAPEKTAGYWIRGDRLPKIEDLLAISILFNVSLDDLVKVNLKDEPSHSVEGIVKTFSGELAGIISKILLGQKEIWDYLIDNNPDFLKSFLKNMDSDIITHTMYENSMSDAKKLEDEGNFDMAHDFYLAALYKYRKGDAGWSAIRCLRKKQDKMIEDVPLSMSSENIEKEKAELRRRAEEIRNDALKNMNTGDKAFIESLLSYYSPENVEERIKLEFSKDGLKEWENDLYIDAFDECKCIDDEISDIKDWIIENIYHADYTSDMCDFYWGEDYINKEWHTNWKENANG